MNSKIKRRSKEFVNIEALCVPVICSPLMGQKPFEIHKTHAEFIKLYLADFTQNIEEKNISILIGLDYYFSFIKGNVIHSGNGNLVALEPKLGWILSGTNETGERISNTHIYRVGGHPLSTYAKCSEELTFLTPWYPHVSVSGG